jgi:hypothetical protein
MRSRPVHPRVRGEHSSCNLFFCNHNSIVKESTDWKGLLHDLFEIIREAMAAAVLMAGVGGYAWGYRSARRETQVVEAGIQQAAFQRGPAAAAAWLGLMVANDPIQALAGRAGSDVKMITGRRACTVPAGSADSRGTGDHSLTDLSGGG